jgi:hypothetical protein
MAGGIPPVDVSESKATSDMQITADDALLLKSMLSAYRGATKAGKWLAVAFVSLLGFIVLASQAFEALKGLFVKH